MPSRGVFKISHAGIFAYFSVKFQGIFHEALPLKSPYEFLFLFSKFSIDILVQFGGHFRGCHETSPLTSHLWEAVSVLSR